MKALDRKTLLAASPDLPSEKVEVPEIGGTVIVRGMTGKEQTALYKQAGKKPGEVDEETFGARLIAHCLVDKDGNRLLEDGEFTIVLGWPGPVFNRLAQAAMRVNGLVQGN